jgi:hypothetical protein
MRTPPPIVNGWRIQPLEQEQREQREREHRVKEDWIESAKRVLIHIQLRDNLEKTVVVRDYDGIERRIVIKPKSSFDLDGLERFDWSHVVAGLLLADNDNFLAVCIVVEVHLTWKNNNNIYNDRDPTTVSTYPLLAEFKRASSAISKVEFQDEFDSSFSRDEASMKFSL